jgi:hypothetical protein
MTATTKQPFHHRARHLAWSAILAAHATLAAGAWWMLPGGFPLSHPRFWVNRMIPILIVAVAILARWAGGKRQWGLALRPVFPAIWLGAVVTSVVVFPVTFRLLWIPLALPLVVMLAMLWPERRELSRRWLATSATVALATFVGAFVVWAQRGGDARTRPINPPIPSMALAKSGAHNTRSIRPNNHLSIEPAAALVTVQHDRIFIGVQPLLTFESRSPDRCWTLLARPADRRGPERIATDIVEADDAVHVRYRDDDASWLNVRPADENGSTSIEAVSRLPRDVY